MSTIKQKTGKCPECKNGKIVPLISGRCSSHYWKYRAELNKNKKSNVEKRESRKRNDVFFASQLPEIPERCEECGNSLKWQKMNNFKSIIAHILPKRKTGGFPNVATHPKNRMFFCLECHGNFDNKGEEFAVNMRSLPLLIERFKEFEHLLSEADKERLPSYLKNIKK